MRILHEKGSPMRVHEILEALHATGRREVKFRSLNSTLGALAKGGKIAHSDYGTYAAFKSDHGVPVEDNE
jgi:hypothetical protein